MFPFSFQRKKEITVLIVLLFTLVTRNIFAQNIKDSFKMAFGYEPNDNQQYSFLYELYKEVFGRLKIDFSYEVLPLRRCSIEADNGNFDGEPLRIRYYSNTYKNMIRVDEPIFENRIAVYVVKDITVTDWESLNKKDICVDYVSGSVQIENRLKSLEQLVCFSAVKSPEIALRRLLDGRSDVFIDLEARVDEYIESGSHQFKTIKLITVIDKHQAYMYVNKKRRNLIRNVEHVLRKIKMDGTYAKIMSLEMPKYYDKYYKK